MPFWHCNIFGIFQRTILVTLSSSDRQLFFVHLSSFVILKEIPDQNVKHVSKVYLPVKIASVVLRLKKCKFPINTIFYVDHVTCFRHPKLPFQAADEIQELKLVLNLKKLKPFFELSSVFWQTVSNFVEITSLLDQHLKKVREATTPPRNGKKLNVIDTVRATLISPLVVSLLCFGGHSTPTCTICKLNAYICKTSQAEPPNPLNVALKSFEIIGSTLYTMLTGSPKSQMHYCECT